MHRPTPSYIQEIGSTLHEVGVCVNRIGTHRSSGAFIRKSIIDFYFDAMIVGRLIVNLYKDTIFRVQEFVLAAGQQYTP